MFDKGINDIEVPTPNTKKLRITLGCTLPAYPLGINNFLLTSLESQYVPLPHIIDITFKLIFEDDTIEMYLQILPDRDHIYFYGVHPGSY